ncbi:MAG TPA: T9SS type A sorting domain-containing protein [Hymenobacter sp.]
MQPMTIEMSTTTEGTITTNNWFTSATFNNPGNRKPDPVPERIPYYNEAMGVFSLLKRPTVQTQVVESLFQTGTSSYYRQTSRYRLAEDLSYVINPASGLEVQDFQAALVVEVQTIGPGSGSPTTNFSQEEAPVVRPDGSLVPTFRTNYVDAACIKNQTFSFRPAYSTAGRPIQEAGTLTLKVILNLRVIGGSSTQQNVLFVARYPVNTLDVGAQFPTLPAATCGVLPQATPATVAALCNSTKYRNAIALSRHGKTAGATPAVPPAAARLQAYPNPATGAVRLRYQLTQAGLVHLTVRDNLGRTVRTVLEQEQPAGPHETTATLDGLRAGIYYCTLQTATQHQVERLVIKD